MTAVRERLAAIKARYEKAKAGPWEFKSGHIEAESGAAVTLFDTWSAEFIAHARTDVPDLVALIEGLLPLCDCRDLSLGAPEPPIIKARDAADAAMEAFASEQPR
jgi:hypothetical protein